MKATNKKAGKILLVSLAVTCILTLSLLYMPQAYPTGTSATPQAIRKSRSTPPGEDMTLPFASLGLMLPLAAVAAYFLERLTMKQQTRAA